MNNIILKSNIKSLSLAEKEAIKIEGRPTPILNLTQTDQSRGRTFTRRFSNDIYTKFEWIAGCDVTNRLYCFPCVLFSSNNCDKPWASTGVIDLKHLHDKAKKHEISSGHVNACTDCALLGSKNIAASFDSRFRRGIEMHNEKVIKNRYILKRIINLIKFCGKLESPVRGHDETQDSFNIGVFLELVDFSAELDIILKEHLDHSSVFKETSKTIQNELLDSMFVVCQDYIKEQIKSSDFFAIQCDETTDVTNKCQMVMIVRYFYSGVLYERFWSFFKIADNTAAGLTEIIENELSKLTSNSTQLIAQTYDGANVMSGSTGGVQAKIKLKYKYAHFVHCYAHQLNLIMEKVTDQDSKVRIFFGFLSAIPTFFSSSTHRSDFLYQIVARKMPIACPTNWNYNIRTVNMVYENREQLIECFQELENSSNKTTCKEANGLRNKLEDLNFIFWLSLFHKIFPHVEILFQQFQSEQKTNVELLKDITQFEKNIDIIRNSTEDILNESEVPSYSTKRQKINPEEKNSIKAKEVCDTITIQIKDRLSYRGHLLAASLLYQENFARYCKNFPMNTLQTVVENYPNLQLEKLKTELGVLYARDDFKNIEGCLNFMSWFSANNLEETYSETVKLIKITITTPMITAEAERCFSTLKRVKTYLRNSMTEDHLNALAMLSINKKLFLSITDFDDKVIDHFISTKDRRMDFAFRK